MHPPDPTASDDEIARLRDALEYHRARCREIQEKLNTYRVKCIGCRCRVLPGETCACCCSSDIYAEVDDADPPSTEKSQ